ncbi:hypothetical protein B5S28_g1748 [[Candida] boidinii]|nr:hypothetical protein B5S28_g1748 [[Candida] boidinii]
MIFNTSAPIGNFNYMVHRWAPVIEYLSLAFGLIQRKLKEEEEEVQLIFSYLRVYDLISIDLSVNCTLFIQPALKDILQVAMTTQAPPSQQGAAPPSAQNQQQQQSQQSQQQQPPLQSTESAVPRDVRLLHLIFATQGINSYQDHVPLQLMDFANRYTTGVLKDATLYNDHVHSSTTGGNMSSAGNSGTHNLLTNEDIRLAIAARTNYQFKPVPPKKLLMKLAAERNEKPLPPVMPTWGIRLPPEKYCLTAKDWDLSEENLKDVSIRLSQYCYSYCHFTFEY